jgi:hypothetical protein
VSEGEVAHLGWVTAHPARARRRVRAVRTFISLEAANAPIYLYHWGGGLCRGCPIESTRHPLPPGVGKHGVEEYGSRNGLLAPPKIRDEGIGGQVCMAWRGITGRQSASHILVVVELTHKAPFLPSEPHTIRQCELTLEPHATSELPLFGHFLLYSRTRQYPLSLVLWKEVRRRMRY